MVQVTATVVKMVVASYTASDRLPSWVDVVVAVARKEDQLVCMTTRHLKRNSSCVLHAGKKMQG